MTDMQFTLAKLLAALPKPEDRDARAKAFEAAGQFCEAMADVIRCAGDIESTERALEKNPNDPEWLSIVGAEKKLHNDALLRAAAAGERMPFRWLAVLDVDPAAMEVTR